MTHQDSFQSVRLATHAMATRFEIVMHGDDPVLLRSAGEEAIREINRIAARFSFYDPASELSRINRDAFDREVFIAGDLFELLKTCETCWKMTTGVFDPTIGPLMKLWGFGAKRTDIPSVNDIKMALEMTGWQHISLDPDKTSIRFKTNGVKIDLGGIAKGWALDEATILLREAGVTSALLHGGTSSIVGIGTPPRELAWTIGIEDPYEKVHTPKWFTTSDIVDSALSVSSIHGKSHEVDDIEYGHVLNPLTGMAVSGPYVSVVEADSAVIADALSTALLAGYRPKQSHLEQAHLKKALIQAEVHHKTDSGWKLIAAK